MTLLADVRSFVKKIISNPFKSAAVAFLIYKILSDNINEESLSEKFSTKVSSDGKVLLFDSDTKTWSVLKGTRILYAGDNERQARQIFGESVFEEAEYNGKTVTLNKPFRTPNGPKKFAVYVKNDKDNVIRLPFGDSNMEIKRDDPDARRSFRARHKCDTNPGPRWKAKYWSCKFWSSKSVSDLLSESKIETLYEKVRGNK